MPIRFVINKVKRFFIYRVLSLNDTPHRIALGVAVGLFVTWTPTIGFQMVLTIALATLLRANKLVGVPFVWISNPFTVAPIYGPNYLVGSYLLGGKYTWTGFTDAIANAANFQGGWPGRIPAWWHATWPIFPPLWIGSFVVALILGALTYPAIYLGVMAYRRHRDLTRPAKMH